MNRSELVDYVHADDTKHPALVLNTHKDGTVDLFDFDSLTVLRHVNDNANVKERKDSDGKVIPNRFCALPFVDIDKPSTVVNNNPLNTAQLFLSLAQETALAKAGVAPTQDQLYGFVPLTSQQTTILNSV